MNAVKQKQYITLKGTALVERNGFYMLLQFLPCLTILTNNTTRLIFFGHSKLPRNIHDMVACPLPDISFIQISNLLRMSHLQWSPKCGVSLIYFRQHFIVGISNNAILAELYD